MRKRKILSLILALAMVLGMVPAALAVDASGGSSNSFNKIAVNKTAKWVNSSNKTAEVTLTVKGESMTPVAIEFVLDGTSSLYSLDDETVIRRIANGLLPQLQGKNTYVGITVFGRTAKTMLPMQKADGVNTTDIENQTIKDFLLDPNQLGTNVEAGLLAGKADLDTAPAGAVKYMVLITDGGSYWWMNGSAPANNTYGSKPAMNSEAADGGQTLATLAAMIANPPSRNAEAAPCKYSSFEKGVYFAYQALTQVKTNDVNLITISRPYYPDSNMEALAAEFIDEAEKRSIACFTLSSNGNELLTNISAGTQIALPEGSQIVDCMGKGTDNVDNAKNYDFELVKAGEITLTVAGNKYTGTLSGNTLTFDDGSMLVYTEGENEKLVLTLGKDLLRGQTLTLSFTEKLASGYSETAGTHYVYTNNGAELIPAGMDDGIDFPSPKLSYTVGGDHGGNIGGGPAMLETVDHVGYIIGRDDGLIHPNAPITRAEVATIFFRLLTNEARNQYWSQTNNYSDVASGAWYNNAISTLSNIGIINGYPDGTFGPDRSITRAELTKIAVSFFAYSEANIRYDGRFTDVTGKEWHANFVAAACALNLINGYADGTFRPNSKITRAETCTIVNRTLGRAPEKNHLLPLNDMILWPDNMDTNAWYYAHMQEATNTHDYTWIDENGRRMEEWTAKLPERKWAALEKEFSDANSAPGGEVMD